MGTALKEGARRDGNLVRVGTHLMWTISACRARVRPVYGDACDTLAIGVDVGFLHVENSHSHLHEEIPRRIQRTLPHSLTFTMVYTPNI